MSIIQNCFTMRMAEFVIEVDSISPRTCVLCLDYLDYGEPDFKIKISDEDIKSEQMLASEANKTNEIVLENTAVYRKITDKLLEYKYVLMHGAVIAVGEYCYMFSAPSGTGKTTHIRLWLQNVKDSYVINGDKPLIKVEEDRLVASGTPWAGKEHMSTNTMKPLKSIVLLERSDNNFIEKISFQQAFPYLVQHTHLPHDSEKAKKVLDLLMQFYEKVTFWRFYCNNFKEDCFRTAYSTLVDHKN